MTNTTDTASAPYVSQFDQVKVLVSLEAGDIHPAELRAEFLPAMGVLAAEGYAEITELSDDVSLSARWTITEAGRDRLANFRALFARI